MFQGVGWWKYEFCYGKYVHQYHEVMSISMKIPDITLALRTTPENDCSLQEKEQGKNIVVVGSWNANEHIEWAKKNVARSYQHRDDGVQKVK